ncbi:unnamed protein product [Porites evermanni]|uniref:Uncharacterized protein n=1 Tax=Porites evermanni TaxID=104178 RepID=A0ABN8LUI4_9CNID|nr:unnamed protein product [Porites evermanni]
MGKKKKKTLFCNFRTFLNGYKLPAGNPFRLSTAFNFIQNNNKTLRNLIVAISTYQLQQLLNARAFHCPDKNYQQYGFTFLFAPVLVLFCLNLLVVGEIWNFTSRMFVKRYIRRGDIVARVLPSLLKACVGPAVWLIVAFREEDYYICAKLGPFTPIHNQTVLTDRQIFERKRKVEHCKSEAQVLAWIIFGGLVTLGTALVVWKNCYFKDNLLMENHYSFERREALSAKIAFIKHIGGKLCEDADIDDDPMTAEYGTEQDRVTLYHNGVPEMIGRKTVEKLFQGYNGKNWAVGDKWHYIKAYKAFKEMYPRISTGSPLDPWRVVRGDIDGTQKTYRFFLASNCSRNSNAADRELEPLYTELELGDPQVHQQENHREMKQPQKTKREAGRKWEGGFETTKIRDEKHYKYNNNNNI